MAVPLLAVAVGVLVVAQRPHDSTGPSSSQAASPSQDPSARCQLAPAVAAQAAIVLQNRAFGSPVTVDAGEAVAFRNEDGTSHTVTEGVGGHAADNACARQRLAPGDSTAVTFHQPGDYQFTCTIHASMHTTVRVH